MPSVSPTFGIFERRRPYGDGGQPSGRSSRRTVRPARVNAYDVRPDECTCSLIPSAFSPSWSGFSGLRRRPLVPSFSPATTAPRTRDPRHLLHHPREVERVMERRDAVDDVERLVGERQVLAVGLDAAEVAVERAAPEPDLRVDEDVGGDELAVALEPEARGPGLRRADLEHAQAAPVADVAAEQHLEGVGVPEPRQVVPPELAVHEREHRVDRVVGLVPALGPGLLDPAGGLAELLAGAGQILVEHQRDPVLDAERAAAARAGQRAVGLREGGAAERAAKELEERRVDQLAGQTTGEEPQSDRAQTPG